MANIVVIGGSGEIGRGIVEVLLRHGHSVVAVGRQPQKLARLAETLGHPPRLRTLAGSVGSDAEAEALRAALVAGHAPVDGVVVSVNAPRSPAPLLSHGSDTLAAVLGTDMLTHYAAAKALVPLLAPGGSFIGIGGGSADFVLEGGIALSVAQAGLRMLYRGLAHEFRTRQVHVHELIVASVVDSASTRHFADPHWVSDIDIGEQIARMFATPEAYADPIWRIARRPRPDAAPEVSAEAPTRVQGFRQALEATAPGAPGASARA
ncbi:MAG: SDR family oxidoreductase [Aromatoleum sp.]|jgi:NAD(P)-dependent dehydrogenase (short-subunit alcohol dehydrogenase family)|uniref:SDR family oxidoreductase n=1 Tax=Aromatoleum sp. TaxID=2307007 RepID=UPI002893BF74|nr:SDR family oxidoreductase [Aromatoleum sp.]MDT3671263.1 SDR family oxidoreductase [Aromatoleum sp.]